MNRTYFFDSALLPAGWAHNVRVQVRDGVIEGVLAQGTRAAQDERHGLVIPGVPNVHSHAFQRAMAGLAERLGPRGSDDFWSWREVMYGFLRQLEADDVEAIAAYAYADMLEAGFTSVAEFHYLHRNAQGRLYANPAELALRHHAAAESTGIGLTLLPVFYEASQFGGTPPTSGQQRFITDLDSFADIVARVRSGVRQAPGRNIGIAPHSLRAVTFAHLARLIEQSPTGPIHIHAAEQMKEVDDCVAYCGARPVEWLLQNAPLDARWCVVHATHVSSAETRGLAESASVAGLCPSTEADLGDGIFPAATYQQANGRWAIGTDSHIALDAGGELRLLEYAQRLGSRSRNVLASHARPSTGRNLYEAALDGGAQALGMRVGAIAPGYRADFLALDEEHPDLQGRSGDTALDTWIFTSGRSLIRSVIAGGEAVVRDRRHRLRERINADYRAAMKRLLRTESA
jgi:formimidoylglutamate deiminase